MVPNSATHHMYFFFNYTNFFSDVVLTEICNFVIFTRYLLLKKINLRTSEFVSLWRVYFGLKANYINQRHFGVIIFNFEQISHVALVIPLLTLNKQVPARIWYVLSCPEKILVLKLSTRLKVYSCYEILPDKGFSNCFWQQH